MATLPNLAAAASGGAGAGAYVLVPAMTLAAGDTAPMQEDPPPRPPADPPPDPDAHLSGVFKQVAYFEV